MNKNINQEKSFMFYPEITDSDFNEKLYLKKEFRDIKIKAKDEVHNKRDFTLQEHQIFLRNYISPDTPYNGILVFHGVGSGKTCTAISIAEGFKKTLKSMNKKILVLTYLKKNFEKELYNWEKERTQKLNPEDIVQCTGKEYELGEDSKYLTQLQKEKEVYKKIRSSYEFMGYGGFSHWVIERTKGWKGEEEDITEKIKNIISNEFDDRVIIIDEIQNIKTDKNKELTKSIQPLLQAIIKYGKNIKLILMSATPMFDRPDEIIFYINLLLLNDGREPINKNDIFNYKDGTLKENATNILKDAFRGYVSFVRAEKPYLFPFRIYPTDSLTPKIEYYISGKKIEKDKQLKYTKLMCCEMSHIQKNTYIHFLDKKIKDGKINEIDENNNENNNNENKEEIEEKKNFRILHDLINISNITFPVSNDNSGSNIGSFSKFSVDSDYDNGNGGYYKVTNVIGSKKKIQFRYQSHAIFNKNTISEKPFADEKYLNQYSTKFASILDTIKKSKGLIFIFSNFIEQGVLPLALMLEQNGFDRECAEGEEQLLDYQPNKLKGGGKRKQICYWCGKDAKSPDHLDDKSPEFHYFKRAKYMLYFVESKEIIKIKKEQAIDKFCNRKNKYGEDVKIFIGTRAVSEGLDFSMLRQVHILEPWYNLSRHEQIIGRAIRFKSHDTLPPEERNAEIYQYAAILPPKSKYGDRESIDLKNYRLAENKDIIIKNITRIMKESAVDCVFLKHVNIIDSQKKEKQITSSGRIIYVNIADKPFSPLCDYNEECNYKCVWEPNPRKKYPINTDTYNIYFAKNDIEAIKKHIRFMFRQNIVYHLKTIEDTILNIYTEVDKLFIYIALEELVNNKNEIVYDKFSRKGYIIYRGDYYIFQPLDLERDDLPIIYRMYPSDFKPNSVNLENIIVNYEQNINTNENKNKNNNNSLIDNFIDSIEILFNRYIDIAKTNKSKFIEAIIGYLFDKLTKKNEYIFIKKILISYINKSDIKYLNNIVDYFNSKNMFINYYSDIYYDKQKIKENNFVGFILDGEYYVIDTIKKTKDGKIQKQNFKIVECSKDIILKIKAYRNISKKNKDNKQKQYNIIYGTLENTAKTKKFKIIDKSSEGEVFTKEKIKSKRSIITGRMCTTYKVPKLLEIRNILGFNKINSKKKIQYFCEEIELILRFRQLINYENKIWFVDSL